MTADTDKPLLLSFPKSGSNWVRYCIEHFSGQRTPGKARRNLLVEAGPTIIDRLHFVDKRHRNVLMNSRGRQGLEDYHHEAKTGLRGWLAKRRYERRIQAAIRRPIVLLLRSHYECYVRIGAAAPEDMIGYVGNIRWFEACERPKLVAYYHEFIDDMAAMGRILDFLGIAHDFADFDLEHHRAQSLQLYGRGPDRPESSGAVLDQAYHSRNLPAATRQALAAYCRDYLGPELYERYLGGFDRLQPASGPSAPTHALAQPAQPAQSGASPVEGRRGPVGKDQ